MEVGVLLQHCRVHNDTKRDIRSLSRNAGKSKSQEEVEVLICEKICQVWKAEQIGSV